MYEKNKITLDVQQEIIADSEQTTQEVEHLLAHSL